MEPTEATSHSLDNLAQHGEPLLRAHLLERGERLRGLVPHLVGLSLSSYRDDGPVTLVATTSEYAVDGPCAESVRSAEIVGVERLHPLDEQRWSLFARLAAASGVRSSLSLPLMDEDVVLGSANLYASTVGAFTGRIEAVAESLGAWAPGAVLDADLDFSTRREAERTFVQLARREQQVLRAAQIVSGLTGVDVDETLSTLAESAARAGVTLAAFARTIVVFHD